MRVVTEEKLKNWMDKLENKISDEAQIKYKALEYLMLYELEEIETLIDKEPDLILAAEKFAEMYDGDERQDIKTDVLNSFYQGAYWQKKNEQKI